MRLEKVRLLIYDWHFQAGVSHEANYKSDSSLSEQGEEYATKMTEFLLRHRETEKQEMLDRGEQNYELKPLTVWTSTRRRTIETAKYLHESGYKVRQRSQMSQLNPGVCESMSEGKIRLEYPEEVAKHDLDPYHHRYPRAEVCLFHVYVNVCAWADYTIVIS